MRRRGAVLWGASVAVVAALCIPAVYLVWRAPEASADAWELFLSARTAELLGQTLGFALLVTVLAAVIALPLAWLTTVSNLPLKAMWTVLLCLPLAVPSYISGYVLLAAFGDGGLLDTWGWPKPPIYGLGGATFALTLTTYPYLFLSFRAALLGQDPALLEAAQSLGHPPVRAFFKVTVPQLLNALRSGSLLVTFYVLSDFGAVSLLQYDTFSRAIYMQLEGAFDRSLAALWSLGLMAIAIVVLALSAIGRSNEGRRVGLGAARLRAPTELKWLTVPSMAVCALVAAAGIGLPLFVIGVWLLRDVGGEAPSLLGAAWNSILASGLAAIAAVVCTLPLSILAARRPSKRVTWLERASYASYSLPPIVVALSLVSFGVRAVPVFYGTLAMLVFAHVVRFAPQAMGAVKGAFVQLSPRLPEAAQSLGSPPARVAFRITLPLIRPGLVAGAALVFLTAMKELPATLILGPIGFTTLSTRVWSDTAEGQFGRGALPALALILVSSLSVAFVLRQEGVRRTGASG